MREIKFRAWSFYYKKFESYSLEQIIDKKVNLWFFKESPVIQQWTGLLDKKDKEIYEGDIVERKYWHNNPPSKRPKIKFIVAKLPIVFSNGCFHLDDYEIRTTAYGTTFNNWWGDGCEIIGNIYENSELLNQRQ